MTDTLQTLIISAVGSDLKNNLCQSSGGWKQQERWAASRACLHKPILPCRQPRCSVSLMRACSSACLLNHWLPNPALNQQSPQSDQTLLAILSRPQDGSQSITSWTQHTRSVLLYHLSLFNHASLLSLLIHLAPPTGPLSLCACHILQRSTVLSASVDDQFSRQ